MASPRDDYLSTEVRTCTPQRLQLMLIEAALRFSERGLAERREGRHDWALGAIIKAQAIVGQILGAIDRQVDIHLADRVSAVYEFIFRRLVAAGNDHEESNLLDAIRILEIERETWRQLCEKLTQENSFRVDGPRPGSVPMMSASEERELFSSDGFSIEA